MAYNPQNANGQATMANSSPVVIASNQSSIPVTGTFYQTTQPVSIASMPSTPVTGTFWQSTQPVSLASLPSLAAGSAIIGKVGIDQTTPGTTNGVQVNAALPAGTNNIGTVNPVPLSNSGWNFKYNAGGFTSTKVQLKGSAGTFGGMLNFYNPNTAATFIQIFNKASASVTVGSTTPDFVLVLPGVASASATGSAANIEVGDGVAMSTGITVAATTTETGSTSPSSNPFITFLYI